jgi:hypothetical protein
MILSVAQDYYVEKQNSEWRIWTDLKESTCGLIELLTQSLSGGNEKYHKKTPARIASDQAEIWTGQHRNTSQKHYCLYQFANFVTSEFPQECLNVSQKFTLCSLAQSAYRSVRAACISAHIWSLQYGLKSVFHFTPCVTKETFLWLI